MAIEGVAFRPATQADLEAQARVFLRAEGSLVRAHNFDWPERPVDAFMPTFAHLLRHDPKRCWVAEQDGRVVGFTAALVRGDLWYFATLFVDPDFQGSGIGQRLFELAHADAPPRQVTLTDSIQPRSNTIYARHGLVPTTPMLSLDPPPGGARLPAATGTGRRDRQGGPEVEPVADADGEADALRRLDELAYGTDREVDHAFLGLTRARTLWTDGHDIVGYSYRGPNRRIGPLAATDPPTAAAILGAELESDPDAWTEVPGTARAMVARGLATGRRFSAPIGLMLASEAMDPPTNLAIADWFLF